jgi:hypothetical protein
MTPEERPDEPEKEIEEVKAKKRDRWDKADVVGKWLIPVAVVLATFWFDYTLKEREARQRTFEVERAANQKTFEVAIGVLQAPKSDETQFLRGWALEEFRKVTGIANANLPSGAIEEIQKGAQLPGTSQLRLPTPGELRVSIIRLKGASADESERIKSALSTAGYTNVTTAERPQDSFPDTAEVRFYFPADSQNAKSLSDYINGILGVATRVNDKSQEQDVSSHRPGDLHVYVK